MQLLPLLALGLDDPEGVSSAIPLQVTLPEAQGGSGSCWLGMLTVPQLQQGDPELQLCCQAVSGEFGEP